MTVLVVAVFVARLPADRDRADPSGRRGVGGAAAMVVLGVVDAHTAFFSEETGIDWNVIFLLFGMMVIVSVLRPTGLFDFLGVWSAQRVRGRPFPLMVMLVVITAVASALLDNVTTILLIVPVTLVVCRHLALPPIPYLIALTLASNIGGMATCGDPPNIIIASRAGLSFNDFLVHLAPLAAILLVVHLALCRVMFRKALTYDPERVAELMALDAPSLITRPRLLVQALAVLALVTTGFVARPLIGPRTVPRRPPGCRRPGRDRRTRAPSIPRGGGVAHPGLLHGPVRHGRRAGRVRSHGASRPPQQPREIGDRYPLAGSVLLVARNHLRDSSTTSPSSPPPPRWSTTWSARAPTWIHKLVVGSRSRADLGGNATPVGASANVVMVGLAAKNGHRISFWTFTKNGVVVTAVTIIIAWAYLWVRYLGN